MRKSYAPRYFGANTHLVFSLGKPLANDVIRERNEVSRSDTEVILFFAASRLRKSKKIKYHLARHLALEKNPSQACTSTSGEAVSRLPRCAPAIKINVKSVTPYRSTGSFDYVGGDPSAGSPTDTLLRLNPPCRTKIRIYQEDKPSSSPYSDGLTGGVCKEQGHIHRKMLTYDY